MFKEADLRIGFTNHFKNTGVRSNFDKGILQRRLLLCLYGLGTNTGLKRICAGTKSDNETDLRYVKKHYIHREHLRNAIASVVNATLSTRKAAIWGEGTTACASDQIKQGCSLAGGKGEKKKLENCCPLYPCNLVASPRISSWKLPFSPHLPPSPYIHEPVLREGNPGAGIWRCMGSSPLLSARKPLCLFADSKKFGSWDQNLMTEWHIRYGGRGVMIYWHVEKKSACIYSQLKTCS